MNMRRHPVLTFIIAVCFFTPFKTDKAFSEPYKALKGVDSVKAVFDLRVKNPRALAIHLDLINDTFEDPEVTSIQGKPDFVVIFMGPAVKFISKNTEGYSPEDKIHLDAIAAMIPDFFENGIKLQVCMFAAQSYGVSPDSILPGIEQVGNGWISSIGYQRQGYALISDF
ncbi:DsrE family protein [Desulfospira joergensenii]|uniref:DsrE family protein n=1 Tax=Desulfospira joergensenii TaxID=53329 RepID=UPI0003B4ED99|nr:DsrE family protein [Desulfospira joergensenii]